MATSSSSQRPIKGILKNKGSTASSFVASGQQSGGPNHVQIRKSKKWDESNIRATCRSAYRDYDLMNTNEPSTPHVRIQDGKEDTVRDLETKDLTRDILGKKLAANDTSEPNCQMGEPESKGVHSSKIFLDKIERQRQFELRRKLHYNEGLNIKLGRELIAKDLQCEEIDDEKEENPPVTNEEKTAAEPEEDGPASDEQKTQACYV
ncbi:protein phosphatase inhibitor 2 family member C [Molossus nigricans]